MKKKVWIFIAVGILVAIVSFILAIQLTPWFYAINTRVRFYLDAPAAAKINICWDKKQIECLPLVPYLSKDNRAAQNNEVADMWLSELPPRPVYSISLQFKSGVEKAKFRMLELDSSAVFLQGFGKENGAGVNKLQLSIGEFKPNRVAPLAIDDLSSFASEKNGLLVGNKEIKSGPVSAAWDGLTTFFIWILLFSSYILIAIPVFLLPNAIRNLGSANQLIPLGKYSWKLYLGCVAVGVAMVALVVNSGVLLHQYDPMAYISLASGGGWFNATRLPGYPFFLAFSFLLFGYSVDGIIALQAVLLVASVLFCVWTLRKWISPYIVLLFVIFCLFSPAQINFARWILRESLFASLVMLGVTAVIAHFTSRKPFSNWWLIFFTAICGLAFLVRENGVILPFALLPVLAMDVIKRLISSGTIAERLRSVLVFLPRYFLPVAAIVMVYGGFAAYNYFHYGYFQMEEQQTSHGALSRAMSPANFDARGLLKPMSPIGEEAGSYLGWPLYSAYILSRDQYPGLDQTYKAFYPSIQHTGMIKRQVPGDKFTYLHQASLLNQIGKNVVALISWRAVLSGVLRQYVFVLYPKLNFPLKEIDVSNAPVFMKVLPVHVTINLEKKSIETQNIIDGYYKITYTYQWYIALFVLALLASFYILKHHDAVFLAPMAVYVANCALVLYSGMVASRVFIHIDVLLVLQVALGISLWLYRNSRVMIQNTKLPNQDLS